MKPAARFGTAIELLDVIISGSPVEKTLTGWARTNRYAGSKDRAAVRDIVFTALRNKRSFAWLGGNETARGIVLGMLVSDGTDPASVFSDEGYAPSPLAEEELSAVRPNLDEASQSVRLNYPDFLQPDLEASLAGRFEDALTSMHRRAPIDLRVNTLKCSKAAALEALEAEGVRAIELPECATTLRVTEGGRTIASRETYKEGLVELQDVASQMAAVFAEAKPGMTVLDYCAGGGGKTLALASGMQGQGRLVAHDVNPNRMKDIANRAARASAQIEIAENGPPSELLESCDLVFVDAPCSGSGAWRRNPNEKWRLTTERLKNFNIAQMDALSTGLKYVRPGGRLVYATCSMFISENRQIVDAVLSTMPHAKLETEHVLYPDDPGDGFYFADINLS